MKTIPKKSPFEGCWQTEWSICQTPDTIAAGSRLAIKRDVNDPLKLTGAWGSSDTGDAQGFRHCGFLTATLGNPTERVIKGTWYEILYKNNQTCPVLSYAGRFVFTLKDDNSFMGTWTDTDGPNRDCASTTKMFWNGKRV